MSAIGAAAQITYRRRATPLHAARATVVAAYGAALALAALLIENPILLAALLAAVLLAAAGAGVGRQLIAAARATALPVLLATVVINVLVSREGITVFARLGDWGVLGQMNLTVEAVVYGGVFALRLLIVTLACLLVVCAADPDELLFALRRVSPSSALTAALATRLVPVLGQDARRLAEAQRCRPDGGARGVRGRIAILRATVAGALDRALDVAAVLEMRGYGARGARRRRGRSAPLSRHDYAFAAAAAALLVLVALAHFGGAGGFDAYPLVSIASGPDTFVLAALIVCTALAPFADHRGIEP
jgi:energy-coupling factor transport system permease protein